MRNKLTLITLLLLIGFCSKSFAQERVISGTVSSEDEGPLPGASVVEKGTSNGTVTDFDGNFQLELSNPSDATLVVTFMGFTTKEVEVQEGENDFNVVLASDLGQLEDVVVVGYGTKKKVNLTGSVSEIDNEAIEGKPVSNAYQALQGEAPGLTIQQGTSEPGSVPQINIRGISTINGNTPLIVVDGVISSLNNINPQNIESISVLKDAASASIYGSRAANGVVLVTTKNGKEGKTQFSYNGTFGVQEATNFPEIADSWEYATLEMKHWLTLECLQLLHRSK